MRNYDIVRGPVVTEKTTLQKDTSNQVTLRVDKNANRVEIKDAVEKNFNTKVRSGRFRLKERSNNAAKLSAGGKTGKKPLLH